MSLQDRIAADMRAAMRDKNASRLQVIRLLRAALQRRQLDARETLDDAGVIDVVQKMVKQCRDAAAQFEKGGREDLAANENAQIEVLQAYLPAALSDKEIGELIDAALAQTGATAMRDMGKVMAALKPKLQGRADMGAVGKEIKQRLGGG